MRQIYGERLITDIERNRIIERVMSLKRHKNRIVKDIGDKSSTICPVCSKPMFRYWEGRWKSCHYCGFHNYYDKLLDSIRVSEKKGYMGESDTVLKMVDEYLNYFREWEPKKEEKKE